MVDIPSASSASGANQAMQATLNDQVADPDLFLKLLTEELKNQNPLEPQKPQEFVSQLAQFSQSEQGAQTNEKLDSLISMMGGSAIEEGLRYIDREVVGPGNSVGLSDGSADLRYELPKSAEEVTLQIRRPNGSLVTEIEDAPGSLGENRLTWDGADSDGNSVADGEYILEIKAVDGDDASIAATAYTQGRVASIQEGPDGAAELLLANGARITSSRVESVSVSEG